MLFDYHIVPLEHGFLADLGETGEIFSIQNQFFYLPLFKMSNEWVTPPIQRYMQALKAKPSRNIKSASLAHTLISHNLYYGT
jgi:hypothetical protein